MQAAELGDQFGAGAEVQVVGIAEEDVRTRRAHLVRVEALDARLGSDGHEGRGRDVSMGGVEDAGARGPVGCHHLEAHVVSRGTPAQQCSSQRSRAKPANAPETAILLRA